MTEKQKENIALSAALLVLLVFAGIGAFCGYFFGYGSGYNKAKAEPVIAMERDTLTDFELLQLAIIYTESEGNPLAVGKNNDLGCMQITPVYVDEVRRITKDTSYCHTDAFNPEKALEMFSIVQDYHNPEHDVDAGIRLHNRAPWYSQKVLRNIQRIKQYEEYRNLVKK
jgi:nucleoside-specific outer membrane channel protein Tsx